ncbi:hypothetical protein Caci_3387 [Catenulispora acidiphila DSM 44928]|uniref:Uncharacterized protein n=1 Tax=Catenulispora acidiphila (strain DSM 44928 / JCM 14897 / NBRC 102108 / NRRL B-24433 / ID139908) TaxID=479433 RepID=C7Q8X3_CATAD|nr:hypothetical protein [Catenulispora acidiphila]ACU72293.1 hypothetical protein Caci_3387 [Catenulispora acidiphila DSM 44928]
MARSRTAAGLAVLASALTVGLTPAVLITAAVPHSSRTVAAGSPQGIEGTGKSGIVVPDGIQGTGK